jgi:glutathione S-transferase
LYPLGKSAVYAHGYTYDEAGRASDGQGVFEGHVSKPISKKQSDLTVYFLSDTVVVLAGHTCYKRTATRAGKAAFSFKENTMQLYTSVGPNPRLVRMFMAERGIDIPLQEVDIMAGENLGEAFRKLNSSAQSPCLQLDNGSVVAEVTVICNYLDEITDGPSLIGATPEERAETRMWLRRFDVRILEPMSLAFRSAEALELFKNRCHVIPQAANDLKATVQESWAWLEPQMAGKQYICGKRFTLADIQLFIFAEFGAMIGQGIPEGLPNLQAWFTRIADRPSVAASLHPSQVA